MKCYSLYLSVITNVSLLKQKVSHILRLVGSGKDGSIFKVKWRQSLTNEILVLMNVRSCVDNRASLKNTSLKSINLQRVTVI